jgi:hypothetical protein
MCVCERERERERERLRERERIVEKKGLKTAMVWFGPGLSVSKVHIPHYPGVVVLRWWNF